MRALRRHVLAELSEESGLDVAAMTWTVPVRCSREDRHLRIDAWGHIAIPRHTPGERTLISIGGSGAPCPCQVAARAAQDAVRTEIWTLGQMRVNGAPLSAITTLSNSDHVAGRRLLREGQLGRGSALFPEQERHLYDRYRAHLRRVALAAWGADPDRLVETNVGDLGVSTSGLFGGRDLFVFVEMCDASFNIENTADSAGIWIDVSWSRNVHRRGFAVAYAAAGEPHAYLVIDASRTPHPDGGYWAVAACLRDNTCVTGRVHQQDGCWLFEEHNRFNRHPLAPCPRCWDVLAALDPSSVIVQSPIEDLALHMFPPSEGVGVRPRVVLLKHVDMLAEEGLIQEISPVLLAIKDGEPMVASRWALPGHEGDPGQEPTECWRIG